MAIVIGCDFHSRFQQLALLDTLYMSDGTAAALPPVTVTARGNFDLKVNQALASATVAEAAAGHLSSYGSLQLAYGWKYRGALLAIMDVGSGSGMAFEQRFYDGVTPPQPKKVPLAPAARAAYERQQAAQQVANGLPPQSIEALWSKRTSGTTAWFAVTNLTAAPVNASYYTMGGQRTRGTASALSLPPHGSQFVSLDQAIGPLPQAEQAAGGLLVDSTSPSGSIAVVGALEDSQTGYSSDLRFTVKGRAVKATTAESLGATGIRVGAAPSSWGLPAGTVFHPFASLRNSTSAPLQVTVRLSAGNTAGQAPATGVKLPVLTVAPGAEQELSLLPYLANMKLGDGQFNLSASFQGHPGDLQLVAQAVDQSGAYAVTAGSHRVEHTPMQELPFWTTRNGEDTYVSLWNPAANPQSLLLMLDSAGGGQRYVVPVNLPGGTSKQIDLAAVQAAGQPDANGNTFPAPGWGYQPWSD